jgi:Post-segregation antitoxin CcdA
MGETDRRNVTVTLRADILQEARHLAVDRNLSLSKYLSILLEEHIEATRKYRAARERQARMLADGFDLGTNGRATWTREELHDRSAQLDS